MLLNALFNIELDHGISLLMSGNTDADTQSRVQYLMRRNF